MPRKKKNNRLNDSDDEDVPSIITADDLENAASEVAPKKGNKKKDKKSKKVDIVKVDKGLFEVFYFDCIFV